MKENKNNKKQSRFQSKIKIDSLVRRNGFNIVFGGENRYGVRYDTEIFSGLNLNLKKTLADNFVYARTRQLAFGVDPVMEYQFARPDLADFADFGIVKDFGKIADANGQKTKKFINAFQADKKKKISYSVDRRRYPLIPQKQTLANRAILAISFGKDSLLSYGLAKELGIDCRLVFVREMENLNSVEAKFKRRIIRDFIKKESVQISYLYDNADEIFMSKVLNRKIKEFDNTNGMLAFLLELLPLAYYHRAKYVIFGNEANFSDYFINRDGYKAFPSFDQSVVYAKKLNQYLMRCTRGNLQSVSLVEPLYNLAEMRILHHRYPDLLQYLMSCSPEKRGSEKWCYECPMCAKAYLYFVAVGGVPKQIGFNRNFFEKKYLRQYALFSTEMPRAYEKPPAVRDEQLLAFLLSYRRGIRGDLMELFVKNFLFEAKKREKSLRQKFFSLHAFASVPGCYEKKLSNIFKTELKEFL